MFLRKSTAAAGAKSDAGDAGQNGLGDTVRGKPLPAPSQPRAITTPPGRSARPGVPNFPSIAAKSGLDTEPDGAKLVVGSDICLKGEISHCDVLVIEGQVDAEHNGKYVRIMEPGRLHGECAVDIADVAGTFEGTLTVRERLILRPSGRVSGHIRYQEIVIEPGGTLSGDVGQMETLVAIEPSRSQQLREALSSGDDKVPSSERGDTASADGRDLATK